MISSFMGLETAKRAMSTAQSALYTTGQNVANANTPGYTRQRVNLSQTTSFPGVGMNNPMIPGQIGTGVQADSVQRIRESFLDAQYRGQNHKIGYYGSMSESLGKIEGIMDESGSSGLQGVLSKFWNSLQDLTSNTDNSGAREVAAASGQTVADTLNYYYNSLTSVQADSKDQITVTAEQINTLVGNIEKLNKEISSIEPHGYLPNDLYDQRDLLVDELSGLINIKVTKVQPENYGIAKDFAEGLYNIEVIANDGKSYTPPITLVGADKTGMLGTTKVEVTYEKDKDPAMVTGVKFGAQEISEYKFSGQLAGLIESHGYTSMVDGVATVQGIYPDMLKNLNNMTEAFANEFNRIHAAGYALGETTVSGENFFTFEAGNAAKTIAVKKEILDKPSLIAAGKSGASGDNQNAKDLADLKSKNFSEYNYYKDKTLPEGLTGSLDSFYAGVIGKLGVVSQGAQKDLSNSITLAESVEKNRQSVSAVSLDEEMTDMIKFQQSYNAAARMVTMVDEMLDKIINGLGTGGR
ncbi:flagellar hook-associated protein FlgK [Peribacillus psychrosaccharolyticus]|uniref:Flagellar hook-associated protein 1 n=1 Tax=Peribacillus psychrosaccharolyticus TaxID=1407 RepID=A0A974NKB1_PERPY|nr:flagellar hook-associated protein FlgK [Peribacillus psychrosaccharolyticus]MEC2055475.1 flagellar hook-associated protein FlgK [Peribacillus psychrosaccharolyticus]MED3743497.1 flagellar hook-associated protein FlgK [Peribacillus psychrosaccharolyticus]QQS99152.1 flagellar hook-associated protein FlgK [Peribacillus psychrosaccharolyticus]